MAISVLPAVRCISMSEFARFCSAESLAKPRILRSFRRRRPYSPAADAYREFRNLTRRIFKSGEDPSAILRTARAMNPSRMKSHFITLAASLLNWINGRRTEWIDVGRVDWSYRDLDVKVNPHFALSISGTPHLIRLHFSLPPVDTLQARVIGHLMCEAHETTRMAQARKLVLDIRRQREYSMDAPSSELSMRIRSEADDLLQLWSLPA